MNDALSAAAQGSSGMSRAGLESVIASEPTLDVVGPTYVVVPRSPGPLVHLRRNGPSGDDDIDVAMDELFGDITDEQPGRFDIALLVIGLALIVWWWASASTGPGLVLGSISIVLGLALPARNVIRGANRRWIGAQHRRTMARGYPLDVSDRNVARLVAAYERVLKQVPASRSGQAAESLEIAHSALIEVASLLGRSRPTAKAEIDYVKKRAQAVGALAAALRDSESTRTKARLHEALQDTEERERWKSAVAEAREQLDASSGLGSLAQLEALTGRIRAEAGHGGSA
jgi:hypothetical protein